MKFKKVPWRHQLEALGRAKDHPHFGLFFEMGTGKTGTAINILRQRCNQHKRLLKTLIFCPPVVIANWKKEFAIHSDIAEKDIILLTGPGSKRLHTFQKHAYSEGSSFDAGMPQSKIFVTNYEALLMEKLHEAFCIWEPDFLICDESHKLKDHTSKRSKLMAKLIDGEKDVLDPVPYRLILTGTPVLNSPMDVFGQFRILDGGKTFGKNYFVFRNRFFYDANAAFKAKQSYFPDWRIKPGALEEMNEVMSKKTMSVKKSSCLDLPPLVKKRIEVELNPEQEKLYTEMRRDLITFLEGKACVATMALTKALRLLQISSGFIKLEDGTEKTLTKTPKMTALSELLESLCTSNKVLVWAVFKENYAQIRRVCEDLGIKYVEVHGEISSQEKQANVDQFNTDTDTRVFIGNPASGGIGINLVVASYSIFYSRNFSLENDLQAEARNYRGGSEMHTSITRIDLVSKGTIDELVLESLASKQAIGEALLKAWRVKL
jgi:SNF2 family DNA or RNA helicase